MVIPLWQARLGRRFPIPLRLSERFRGSVKSITERDAIPLCQFHHKERKDDIANEFRRQRPVRDGIVCIGVAQEKAQAFNGKKGSPFSVLLGTSALSLSRRRETPLDLSRPCLPPHVIVATLQGWTW
jgi:hypothetical protein